MNNKAMKPSPITDVVADEVAETFFRRAFQALNQFQQPFLVGGAYALQHYLELFRRTKDIDIFVKSDDAKRTLDALSAGGFEVEMVDPLWLAKCFSGDHFIDVIFNSGNGLCPVDDDWFTQAVPYELFGLKVLLCPPEEMIWQKAYIMERHRYDGADVVHLILRCGKALDWDRLLKRFEHHPHLLLSYLMLFEFVYPDHRGIIPVKIFGELLDRRTEQEKGEIRGVSNGFFLSRSQYEIDEAQWKFRDPRVTKPKGSPLTAVG